MVLKIISIFGNYWKKICAFFFIVCLHVHIVVENLVIKRDWVPIDWFKPVTLLCRSHYCAGHRPVPGFQSGCVVVFYVLNDLRSEVIVRFVDFDRLVDRCLIFSLV